MTKISIYSLDEFMLLDSSTRRNLELTETIRGKDMTAWSFLSQGSLVSSTDHHFVWQAKSKEGEQPFISALNKPERNKIICDCLSDLTGDACTFTAVENGKKTGTDDDGDENSGADSGKVTLDNDHSVAFTNTRNGVIPTGIIMTIAPFAIGICVFGAVFIFIICRKKRRSY